MDNINLVSNGVKLMTKESLLQYYNRNFKDLQHGTIEGIKIAILANYDGYITAISLKNKAIIQGWAGQFVI